MKTALGSLLVAAGMVVLPLACRAQSDDPKHPEVLAKRFVDAVGSKSPERLKALAHPKSLACMTAQNQEFYDSIFSRQSKYTVPANYKTAVEPVARNQGLLFENELVYPLRPSHELQIHFKTENTESFSGTTVVLLVVYDAGRWYEVLPCPGPDTIAKMRVHKEESAKQDRKAQQLAANLSDPLRAELMDLLKKGQRVSAMKRYAAASGEDLTMANRVVDLLAPRAR
jgi:hypothetical protein